MIKNIKNETSVHRASKIPVFKVAGFDGYDFASLGVTNQFLDNSAVYFEKYTNPAHFRNLYKIALGMAAPSESNLSILDLGTGGGNSVFAIFELLGATTISALGIDISPQLLEMCSDAAEQIYNLDETHLRLLCADLYELHIEPQSFDLVTGSSILHHMIDPGPIVRLALSALKPGGSAIFTEPFEDGSGLLVNAYATIIKQVPFHAQEVPADLLSFMNSVIYDFEARKGIGNVRDYTQHLDDKWYFTRSWFNDFAREANCDLQIAPTHGGGEQMFWQEFKVTARLHNGANGEAMPDWAASIIHQLDATFSSAQKRDFLFTGIVVLTKQ